MAGLCKNMVACLHIVRTRTARFSLSAGAFAQDLNGVNEGMKQDVNFNGGGLRLAGHLYIPEGALGGPLPAIVVGHPGTGVKEQTAGLYAQRLADAGFVALTFDAAHQGESEGMPRNLEDPARRVEDFKAAVSFLSAHAEVDPQRIGALGVCASGGYAVAAAVGDVRIRALATVSAVDMGRQFRVGADGMQDQGVFSQLLQGAAAARTAAARGEGMGVFPIFPESGQQALSGGQHLYDGWEYYCTPRAQHPRSAKGLTWDSIDRIANFDAFRYVQTISPRPLLMIAGSKAVSSWMSSEAIDMAREPKELFWIEGASHVDLYDKPQFVGPAVARLADFFRVTLPA